MFNRSIPKLASWDGSGTTWDGSGTGSTHKITRVYRVWDGGTAAALPCVSPLPHLNPELALKLDPHPGPLVVLNLTPPSSRLGPRNPCNPWLILLAAPFPFVAFVGFC